MVSFIEEHLTATSSAFVEGFANSDCIIDGGVQSRFDNAFSFGLRIRLRLYCGATFGG